MSTDSWSAHLGSVGHFDPGSLAGPSLPALWARHWGAAPSADVLRVVGAQDQGTRAARWWVGGALDEGTRAAAELLAARGLGRGDRLLWSCQPTLPAIVACLGALRLGAVVVPANPAYTERELAHIVRDVRPQLAVVDRATQGDWISRATGGRIGSWDPELKVLHRASGPGGTDGSARLGDLDVSAPDDPALIVYTSGTTGAPKGAVLSHRNLSAAAASLRIAWDWRPEDRLVSALPLFHVHGLCVALFGSLAAGGSVEVLERFEPSAVLDAVDRPGATMFFGVPTMYHRMLQTARARSLAQLRLCVSGSAPLAGAQWQRWRDETGVSVLERYGMTETLLTISNPLRGERRPGTVGFALPGVEVRIEPSGKGGSDGELEVRGPTVFSGYWERPSSTAECLVEGWFRTGDLGHVDADGYYSIRGRRGDLVISGGYNVYPAEVEDVLLGHPGVLEVAVAARPSDEFGEEVTAWVVCAGGRLEAVDLLAYAAGRLAPYKRPRQIHFVDSLPRNAMGKVLRSELR